MNQVIHVLLILNLLNIKQELQRILIMLLLVKLVMRQIKLVKMKLKLLFCPLKHLSLNIPLINCAIELILTWSKNCVLADMTPGNHPPGELSFKGKDTKLYVPVVTLSKENDIKLLEQLKSGFKRTIKWNECRSQMTVQPQNNHLNYLTDPTFKNVNILFALSFARNIIGDARLYFRLLCMKR